VANIEIPFWVFFIIFMGFAVKLPLYGLHYWLPQAHVEAPTVGSMVLAGLLLKLGGYGLIRMFFLIDCFLNRLLVSYIIVSILLVSIVTCYQSDFKRLVAYSSVIHMTAILLLLLRNRSLTLKVYLIIMVFHGILSPITFYLVGIIYSLFKRRLLVHMGGVFSNSFILYAICLLVFLMSIPTPPFPQFYFEVLIFVSTVSSTQIIYFVLLGFTFLRLLVNLV
jgi:NADH-quinone oxidoreductase subunit M